MDERNEIISQVLELLDTACQASLELLELFGAGNVKETMLLLQDLRAASRSVSETGLASQLEHSCAVEMQENIEDTLDEIERAIHSEDTGRAAMKMEFQLFPFLRQLKECISFWGTVYPDPERMSAYYQNVFAERAQNYYLQPGQPAAYQLSIVVPAYNHLETTKRCIDQLLKETDFEALRAELILMDHGSTDGTLEYLEGLGIGKVIHFKKNVRMNMFTTMFQICQGEYLVYISNDILVTKNWAEILLTCLKSDPNIIVAVPATPNIANFQMLHSPTNDPDAFVRWADGQNRSDPLCWSDRARVMPPIGMYRSCAVNQIGFADPYFYTMEFWDDDFSLRARRAGYRQVVCSDVACYHFGSVTAKEGYVKENTLAKGRELFAQKNGVDAWGSGFCYDYQAIQLMKQMLGSEHCCRVLGLDCGMGDTLLQVKNELRYLRRGVELYQLTCQQEYLEDIKPHSQKAQLVPILSEGVEAAFEGKNFNLIYLGRDIGQYEEPSRLLQVVSRRLAPGGWFVCTCENPFSAAILHSLLRFSVPEGRVRWSLADPEQIHKQAQKCFAQVQMIPVEMPVEGVEAFAACHYGKTDGFSQLVTRLKTGRYYFACRA